MIFRLSLSFGILNLFSNLRSVHSTHFQVNLTILILRSEFYTIGN